MASPNASLALLGSQLCVYINCSVLSDSLWPYGLYPTRLLCPWDSPGKNIGAGCQFFLQGIFPDPGLEPGSPTLQADSLLPEPPGKLFWADYFEKQQTREKIGNRVEVML